MEIERRYIAATEIRASADGVEAIEGYAALYDTPSELLGSGAGRFRESIARGAFANVLKTADVRALFNHDPNYVLGRTTSGTLSLEEDQRGLKMRVSPPDTQWARDLMVSIRRGDVSGMSFGFKVAQGGQKFERRDGEIHRTITDVGELLDVSPVTYPAYPDTSVAVRSLEQFAAEPVAKGYPVKLARARLKQTLAR